MGLTRTEAAILDRWDSGQPCRQIAREIGLKLTRVQKLVRDMDGNAEHRTHRNSTAASSLALREAIFSALATRQKGATA